MLNFGDRKKELALAPVALGSLPFMIVGGMLAGLSDMGVDVGFLVFAAICNVGLLGYWVLAFRRVVRGVKPHTSLPKAVMHLVPIAAYLVGFFTGWLSTIVQ